MTNATQWYTAEFKAWQKGAGVKPSADQLQAVHDLGLRPGKQALACAMALRDTGTTGSQIVIACGAPQLNRMRGLIDDKLVRRVPCSRDDRNHTVYKLELTEKGEKRIATSRQRDAEVDAAGKVESAAKPKGESEAKTAKGKAKVANRASKPRKATADALPTVPFIAVDDEGNTVALPAAGAVEHVTELPPVTLIETPETE